MSTWTDGDPQPSCPHCGSPVTTTTGGALRRCSAAAYLLADADDPGTFVCSGCGVPLDKPSAMTVIT